MAKSSYINEPSYVKRFLRSKTISESSDTSIGTESLPEMDVVETRNRSGSVNSREAINANAPEIKMENVLYDKYLAK